MVGAGARLRLVRSLAGNRRPLIWIRAATEGAEDIPRGGNSGEALYTVLNSGRTTSTLTLNAAEVQVDRREWRRRQGSAFRVAPAGPIST
jgi:hypothetical protein